MLYEEESIYPTWLAVPVKAERIDVLEVDFRLFGDPEGDRLGLMCNWKHSSDVSNPSPIIWGLRVLSKRFLTGGPDFLSRENDSQRIEVERLVLNVIDTADLPEDLIWGSDGYIRGIMRSKDVVRRMMFAIKYLLTLHFMSEQTFEGVKTIVLCDDGVAKLRWNLQDMPAQSSGAYYGSRV